MALEYISQQGCSFWLILATIDPCLCTIQVHPLLSDLIMSLSRVPQLSPDFEGKVKGKEWIARLNKMGASDELTEQQARQLLFDLETSYNGFIQSLPKSS